MSGEERESCKGRLTPLQGDLLEAFFSRTSDFFLTGGAALIGFYGVPRSTNDLDLFTLDEDIFPLGDRFLRDSAAAVGATVIPRRAAPHFRRYTVQRGEETLDVDLVHENVPQWKIEKMTRENIRIDPLEEIVVNKMCAVLGRAEVRDLWDLYHLLQRGYSFDEMLEAAGTKDGGANAESLTFVLSTLNWNALQSAADQAGLPGFGQVATYFRHQAERLALQMLPADRRPEG